MFIKTGALAAAVVLLTFAATMATAQGTDAKAAAADDYHTNPKFLAAVKEAKELERQTQPMFAADAYKKANKIAGGQCVECMAAVYKLQMKQGSYKDAIGTAMEVGAVGTTPLVKSVAEYDRGRALIARDGDKPKPEQLEEALAAFQQAVKLYPQNVAAMYEVGEVQAQLGRMDEARKQFQLCLSNMKPGDTAWLRIKHFADDPELATHKMAPPFEVTAMDGTKFNLDSMGGRVVLIDFWATWCGPCNRELPHMKKIAKEFANDPLVIISVSWDSDEAKWKDFVAKNEMTWVQYRDTDHSLSTEFGINAIPHYFTIDSDGVLTAEMLGEDQDVEGKLKKLIAKARAAKVQAAEVRGPASTVEGAGGSGN
ncbi:redoxin family protein [Granulicella sp. L46]|uniref:redoxin family protein n=1 Tax=Granulicella sp. L46 TaxID=1641865 RepID=UPI0020B12C59|nr:redoxin family protein [Granulicella sp. L46]